MTDARLKIHGVFEVGARLAIGFGVPFGIA
jgi:hypothetical protein